MGVSHDSASRRAGLRHLAEGRMDVNGGANNWTGMALDEARGIVYVPTGSAVGRFLRRESARRQSLRQLPAGAERRDRPAPVALPGRQARHLGSRFSVAADPGDADAATAPRIDAVVQTSKQGFVFAFDRTNGTPLFPIEYRKFPESDLAGEVAAETQPMPTSPQPFARQLLTRDMLTTRTPEAHQWALDKFATFRSDGLFVPLARRHATPSCFPASTAAPNGAGRRSIPRAVCCTSTRTIWPGRARWRRARPARAAGRCICRTARRATRTIAPGRRRRFRRSWTWPRVDRVRS